MRRRRAQPLAIVAALIAIAVTTWMQRGADAPRTAPPARTSPAPATITAPSAETIAPTAETLAPSAAPAEKITSAAERRAERYDLSEVPEREREQLRKTLRLIDAGGPFPYPKKDGSTFGNREGQLPTQARGYYREYTVPTPGAKNRGARRVVQGKGGETYYTNDHYRSFMRLDR